jgi:hypothetical protein
MAALTRIFGRMGHWMRTRLVEDVPDDLSACEYDCDTAECSGETFDACERRKRAASAAHDDAAAAARPAPTEPRETPTPVHGGNA